VAAWRWGAPCSCFTSCGDSAPPPRLPYLHAALFVTLSFFGFVLVFALSTYLQWTLVPEDEPLDRDVAKRKLE